MDKTEINVLDYACDARFKFNKHKNVIGECHINKKFYNVFEFDMRDLYHLDDDNRELNAEYVMAMILIAIPDCPIEDVFNLTKMEATNLAAMIYSRIDFAHSDYQDYISELN